MCKLKKQCVSCEFFKPAEYEGFGIPDGLCDIDGSDCSYDDCCENYEVQHECDLEHVVDLADVPDFEPDDVPF